jgi:hypothetical protein
MFIGLLWQRDETIAKIQKTLPRPLCGLMSPEPTVQIVTTKGRVEDPHPCVEREFLEMILEILPDSRVCGEGGRHGRIREWRE